jgi:Holliday junction resolvase RusA-like endonuclease
MCKVIRIEIKIEPVAKGRPKITFRNGRVWTYSPPKTENAQKLIAMRVMRHIDDSFGAGVALKLTATFFRTKSKYLKKTEVLPFRKPDIINFGSLLLDGINKTIYDDDAQVTNLHILKRWSQRGYGYITLRLEEDSP